MTSSLVLLATQARALDELLPCRRQNAQLWFSDLPAELQLAKAYCQPCPVRRVCLTGAVERHEPHGVWGGEIFARGAIIAHKKPRGRPPRMEGRAKSELPARRSSLADHSGLRNATTMSVTAGAPERRLEASRNRPTCAADPAWMMVTSLPNRRNTCPNSRQAVRVAGMPGSRTRGGRDVPGHW